MNAKNVGMLGGVLASVGIFLPFASFPIVGSINLLKGGEGDGVIILPIILVGLITLFYQKYKTSIFFNGLAFMAMVFEIVSTMSVISEAKAELAGSDDVFGFGEAFAQSISLEVGGFVILAGVFIAIVSASKEHQDLHAQ